MIFQRFEDDGLAHYSYLLASDRTGVAFVVDPRRDIDGYLRFAADHGLRIGHVLETHIHADYASGAAELARRTGALLHLSAHDRGERYQVSFPHQALRDGDELTTGELRLCARHTPGHTPEHLAFLVYDDDADGADPERFLSGDFLFIGSVGRPDLLGDDAKRELAGALHDSIRRVVPGLPDDVLVHPAHGSGSMCGGGMSQAAERRLGEERQENPFLDPGLDRDTFTRRLLETLPPYPDYYLRMKERNAGGEGHDRPWPEPVALPPDRFLARTRAGAVVVDTRHQLAFGGGHVPDAFGIGLDPDLSTWAGWVVPYDRPVLLVTGDADDVPPAVTRLARVGLDLVEGYLEGAMDAWIADARALESIPQWAPHTLRDRLGDGDGDPLAVLDVRTDEEWEEGHIEGAIHIMGGRVQDALGRRRMGEGPDRDGPPGREESSGRGASPAGEGLPDPDTEIAVICGSGYRSTVVASVLQRHSYSRVRNVPGGMEAWEAAGLPTVGPD